VVVAASASSPSGATISASQNPITDCVARAKITGHASVSSVCKLRVESVGAGEERSAVVGMVMVFAGRNE
jgi:hypothetical protein